MLKENHLRYTRLAIVVPAYKIDYFKFTLDSFANQTCKDFTIYVGDDCSPSDFGSLIQKYEDKINIVYHRFEENLGGKDLVAHWKRCISLTQGEPWIWLFSDDDVMGDHCVESFYREITNTDLKYDLYHFNISVIDSHGDIIERHKPFPSVINSKDFYKSKASAKLESFVVEYILSRDVYERTGGFVNFELAWGSDIATWVRIGHEKGIKTISGPIVYWRKSKINITPNLNNEIVFRKAKIEVDYLNWMNHFFKDLSMRQFNKYILFRNTVHYSNVLDKQQHKEILKYAQNKKVVGVFFCSIVTVLYPIIRTLKMIKG